MAQLKKYLYLLLFTLIIASLKGCDAPDTYIYLGHQTPKKFIKEIINLGLLNDDEKIIYFYSDGLTDIKEGLYFVTNKKLVVYNKEWIEPKTIVKFEEIINLDVEYNDSFYEDSFIMVTTPDFELEFPVSSERKRDRDFYNYLLEKSNLNSRK